MIVLIIYHKTTYTQFTKNIVLRSNTYFMNTQVLTTETVVGRLDIVPYIRTFVQYDGTFGASDQGRTLDV